MNSARLFYYFSQLVLASLSGYLLVRLVSYLWGTGGQAAAFEIAWSIPMLLITASGLNVMQAVTARFFSGLRDADELEISSYISSFLNLFAVLVIPMIGLVSLYREEIAALAAPGLSLEMQALTAQLILVLAPLSCLFGFGLFFGGVYAAFGKPIVAEIVLLLTRGGAVALAVVSMAAGVEITPSKLSAMLLAVAVMATLFVYRQCKKHLGFRYQLTMIHSREIVREMGVQVLLFLLVALLGQGVIVYYRSALSVLDVDLVAGFSYAMLITYTFSNVIGKLGFFSSTLPTQKEFNAGNLNKYRNSIVRSGVNYLILSVVFSVLLSVNSEAVIKLLFGGGEFGLQSVAAVKRIYDILIISVPATTLIWVLKLPSITGPYRIALPLTEMSVWAALLFAVIVFPVFGSADAMMMLLVGSYWTRVLASSLIVACQIAGQRRRSGYTG